MRRPERVGQVDVWLPRLFIYTTTTLETCLVGSRGIKQLTMPLFRITVKSRVNTNGIRLEPGMSVDVVSQSFSDPVHTNGGQSVADAFMRIYGVDIKKAGALNGVYLKVDKIG